MLAVAYSWCCFKDVGLSEGGPYANNNPAFVELLRKNTLLPLGIENENFTSPFDEFSNNGFINEIDGEGITWLESLPFKAYCRSELLLSGEFGMAITATEGTITKSLLKPTPIQPPNFSN